MPFTRNWLPAPINRVPLLAKLPVVAKEAPSFKLKEFELAGQALNGSTNVATTGVQQTVRQS